MKPLAYILILSVTQVSKDCHAKGGTYQIDSSFSSINQTTPSIFFQFFLHII